jgi:HEAT repeat protein
LAAKTLGGIGPAAKAAVADLRGALQDKEIEVREQAAQALTRIGADAGSGTATALVAALLDPDVNVSRRAREGLDKLETLNKEEVPGLIAALEKGNEDVRAFAVAALGKIGPGARDAVPILVKTLTNDREQAIRRGAAEALGKIGPAAWSAATALGKALQDTDLEMRTRAAVALGRIGPDARAGVPGLMRALKDKPLQEEATRALVRIGRAAIRDLIEAAENPKDYELRLKALGVLGKMGPEAKEAVEALTTIATMDKAGSIRQAAKEALAKIQAKPK